MTFCLLLLTLCLRFGLVCFYTTSLFFHSNNDVCLSLFLLVAILCTTMYCMHTVDHVNKPWYAIMQDSLFSIHCLQPTKTHLKKLPEDLKLFYRTFDGFVVEWDVKLKGDALSHLMH